MTILEQFEQARVFSVEQRGDLFWFEDACDYCFGLELSRAELRQLANELIELADKP